MRYGGLQSGFGDAGGVFGGGAAVGRCTGGAERSALGAESAGAADADDDGAASIAGAEADAATEPDSEAVPITGGGPSSTCAAAGGGVDGSMRARRKPIAPAATIPATTRGALMRR